MKAKTGKLFCFCTIIFLLAACSASQSRKAEENRAEHNRQRTMAAIGHALDNANETETRPLEVPEAVQKALLPETSLLLDHQQSFAEKRFDIAVKNVYARNFFMGLVSGSPLNMVIHPDVKGKITLNLKNVSIDEILETTREIYGYEYKKQKNGYLILPARMQSRIFHINYLNVSRQGSSQVSVSAGQLSSSSGSANNSNNTTGNSRQSSGQSYGNNRSYGNNTAGGSSAAIASTQISTHSKADFWATLKQSVLNIIGKKQGRSVVISPQAGLIVVRAMPAELRDVEAFLKSAQKNLQRQVIIEAKIIEVSLNEASKSGIDWAYLQQVELGSLQQQLGSTSASVTLGSVNISNGSAGAVSSGANMSSLLSQSVADSGIDSGGMFALGVQSGNFAALLSILNTQGDAQVLSSPRIATLNNQKAVIKVGSDEFFVTDIQTTNNYNTTGNTAASTTPSVSLTPFFSGIALDVTPQITDDNSVILHIHPQVSEVKDQVKNFTIFGSQQSLPLALSSVRESDSVIEAKNGQIIVIGGLMQERSDNRNADNFGLADIPLLGGLFHQSQRKKIRSELVILLKPTIIDQPSVWQKQLDDVRYRVDRLYQ